MSDPLPPLGAERPPLVHIAGVFSLLTAAICTALPATMLFQGILSGGFLVFLALAAAHLGVAVVTWVSRSPSGTASGTAAGLTIFLCLAMGAVTGRAAGLLVLTLLAASSLTALVSAIAAAKAEAILRDAKITARKRTRRKKRKKQEEGEGKKEEEED